MTKQRADLLLPLLRVQPYISGAWFVEKQPPVDCDLNQFRLTLDRSDPHANLARLHLQHFGLSVKECESQWLFVPNPLPIEDKPVLITRTLRYPGHHDWKRIVDFYGSHLLFIGLPEEHADFCLKYGSVEYRPTRDFLEVARLLAGCELFITNQNGCHAVAEGLKVNVMQEPCPSCRVAMFERANAWYDTPEDLPALTSGVPKDARLSLTFRSCIDGFSGVGQSSTQFIVRLHRRGHDIACVPTRESHLFGNPIQGALNLQKQPTPGSRTVVYETTGMLDKNLKTGDTAITLWESDRWPKVDVDALNRCKLVLVTCKWNAETLAQSGCNVPIRVIPLGVDPDVFRPGGPRPTRLTIGAAGRVAGAGGRKGIDTVIQAFLKAFQWRQDVRLRIKVFSDCPISTPPDPRIEINRDYLTVEQMAEWHRGNTMFVSATRGEGWNLCLHEAMGCGAAPVACNHGGQAEFFDRSVGYELPFEIQPVTGSGTFAGGNWAVPSFDALIYTMRRAYINPDEVSQFGIKASLRAHQFSWEHAVNCLEAELFDSQ